MGESDSAFRVSSAILAKNRNQSQSSQSNGDIETYNAVFGVLCAALAPQRELTIVTTALKKIIDLHEKVCIQRKTVNSLILSFFFEKTIAAVANF